MFQVHGVDERGHALVKKTLKRAQLPAFFASVPPCLVGMEACSGAHFWARKLQGFGHTVRLISPQFVRPYLKSNKTDAADAAAICEAVGRPDMRYVPIKSIESQGLLVLHRARQGFIRSRVAQTYQIRGFLAEFGIIIPQGAYHIQPRVAEILEDAENALPGAVRELLLQLVARVRYAHEQEQLLEARIKRWHKNNEASSRLAQIPGIGPLTASALVASIGDVSAFRNGRQLTAWLGLVPRQHFTGGKAHLLGISRRGDTYLRTLLTHGARSVIICAKQKPWYEQSWLGRLLKRKHHNVVVCALANHDVRVVWALLKHDRQYRADFSPQTA